MVLRHARSGFFYGGRGMWVDGPSLALDLRTIERAVDAARDEDFGGLEVVACYGDPDCEFVLSVRWTGTNRGKDARARSGSVAIPPPAILPGGTIRLPPRCVGWG